MANCGSGFTWVSRVAGLGAALALLSGCPSPPETPVSAATTVQDACGRKPKNLAGNLSKTTREDIKLFVSTDGSDATARHVTESLAKEVLACDALSYRACEAAVKDGASQGLALEMHRLAMASNSCQKTPQPVAVGPRPRPQPGTTNPSPRPRPGGKPPAWRPGKFMVQALTRVVSMAQKVQKTTSYSFDSTGSSVLGAFLNRGQAINLTRTLDAGVKYAIIGGGSDSVQDLDIEILAANGQRIAADVGGDNRPVVEFRPPAKGSYKIVLRLSKSRASGSFTAISILRSSGGYNVPMKRLASSFGNALALAAIANDKVVQRKRSLVFHAGGDWCFYGSVMEQGKTISFSGVEMKQLGAVAMAATDGTARDVDVRVVKSRSKAVVASDTGADNTPVTIFQPDASTSYTVKVTNKRSPKPSMVTLMLLDVVK